MIASSELVEYWEQMRRYTRFYVHSLPDFLRYLRDNVELFRAGLDVSTSSIEMGKHTLKYNGHDIPLYQGLLYVVAEEKEFKGFVPIDNEWAEDLGNLPTLIYNGKFDMADAIALVLPSPDWAKKLDLPPMLKETEIELTPFFEKKEKVRAEEEGNMVSYIANSPVPMVVWKPRL